MTSVLQKLYASIRNEPLKFPEDDGNDLTLTFFNPDREGWLLKMGECPAPPPDQSRADIKAADRCRPVEGGRVKTWKRRWFILTDSCLYYFEYTTVSKAEGVGWLWSRSR